MILVIEPKLQPNELVQSLLQFLDGEPVGVEWHHVRRPVLVVISGEVLLQPFEDVFGVMVVQHALVQIKIMYNGKQTNTLLKLSANLWLRKLLAAEATKLPPEKFIGDGGGAKGLMTKRVFAGMVAFGENSEGKKICGVPVAIDGKGEDRKIGDNGDIIGIAGEFMVDECRTLKSLD
nr:unnamed protein product [Callosobruchus chinensis]